MNDPVRLLSEGSEFDRALLSAARGEQPSDAALQRTLAAVAAGATVLALATPATAAAPAAGATSLAGAGLSAAPAATSAAGGAVGALVAKWLGLGVLAGAVTVGAAHGVGSSAPAAKPAAAQPATTSDPAYAPRTGVARYGTPGVPVPDPAPPEATGPDTGEAARAGRSASSAAARGPALAEEVQALDRARSAVRRGDAPGALAEVEAYERRFGQGALGPEALVVKLEALLARGDRAGAEAAARRLLAEHPASPHALRARRALEGTPPDP